jgi:hypothetical protein
VKAAYVTNVPVDNNNIVKTSFDCRSVERLQHEIKVYTSLMVDIGKFLDSRKNPRARFLLNIPSLVRIAFCVVTVDVSLKLLLSLLLFSC